MTLLDVLKMISKEYFPPVVDLSKKPKDEIDTRPQTVFNITICFMSEQETWLTCNIQNEILIPWYDCEVLAINPSERSNTLCAWLKDKEYILSNYKHCIEIVEEEK